MQLNGLRLDGKFSDSAPFTWAYAKNILLSRGFDRIENEPGDTLISTIDGDVIGRVTVPNGFLLFSWYDSKGYIKFVDSSNAITDLVTGGSTYLDFDSSTTPYKYIEGVHYYTNEGDLIVAWTTGVGKPMIINVTHLLIAPITISSESDLKSWYLFPEFNHNNFSLTNSSATTNSSIITGGRLPSAAYFVSLAYEIDTDVLSNFGVVSSPIFITDDDSITAYKQFKGNASLVVTNKAIVVNVSDLDTTKIYFKIALIQKTTTSTICYITRRFKVTSGTVGVLIDDLDKLTLFDINDVLISSPGYIDIKTLVNVNKRLRIGNISKPTKLSLQEIYDNILTPRTLTVSTISRASTTVTVVCSVNHTLTTGDIVAMNGWAISAYNGYFEVTVDDATTFHYITTSGVDSDTPGVGKTAKVDRLIINWITEKQASLYNTKGSYKDSIFIFNSRGFRTDEVYSLYFGLRLKTGGFYGVYHIPGRETLGTENSDTTVVDGDTIKDYKLGSTAIQLAGQDYGKMGFWENEDEVYPTEYGNIAGEKIRHHRFPSAGQLHGWNSGILHFTNKSHLVQTLTFDTYVATFDINYDFYTQFYFSNLFSLGTFVQSAGINTPARYTALYSQTFTIALDINVLVYDFFEEGVLMHGEATLKVIKYINNGTSFVATNLINQTLNATTNGQTLHFTLASTDAYLKTDDYITIELTIRNSETMYPGVSNATSSSINIYEDSLVQDVLGLQVRLDSANIDSSILTSLQEIIDSFEILYAKRTLNNQLVLDQSIVVADGAGYRFYGFDSMANLLNIEPTHIKSELYLQSTDYNSGEFVNEVIDYSLDTTRISKVSAIRYLPAYNTATVPSNDNKENCYYIEPTSGTFNLRLVNLLNVKDNLYLDFSNQELISTGVIKRLTDNTIFLVYGGDTYIGHNSVVTFISSLLRIWYFPVESILNTGMRYEGENTYEKFYPLTDITEEFTVGSTVEQSYIVAMKAAGIANYYIYNNDFHLLNNFRQDNIDNELTSLINNYPNRIHSSMPVIPQSSSIQWYKFKPLDYFDMVNHKGEIYKMLGNEYIVYIQTRYSIFRGIVVDQMEANNVTVGLKTTEMFDRPLQELLDADGMYIQPWNKEGTILTPYGLVVADLNKGSIYVISDKANEITKLGIEDWFRNLVTHRYNFGNKEQIGTGVSLGYDDLHKRLLVSLKSGISSTTFKYGALYNWLAATDVRNICADGWHIPMASEFNTLLTYLGGGDIAGGKLKEIGYTYWNEPNSDASNESGFNARGAGVRGPILGDFEEIKNAIMLWTSEEVDPPYDSNAYSFITVYDWTYGMTTVAAAADKKSGISIRPIKDFTTLSDGETGTYTGNDGRVYRTICIDTQEWLADNLAETKYRDGSTIPIVTDNSAWAALTTGAMCYYNNDINNAYESTTILDGLTLSFSFEKMYWLCFHDYLADKYIWNSNGLYMINSSVLYKLLTGNYGYYMGVYCNSIIDFIFNNNRGKRFLLENVNWITNIDNNGINVWNETISKIFIYSKHFATLLTDIVKREYGYDAVTHEMTDTGNTLYQDGRWTFNDIKDYLSSLSNQILDSDFEIIDASFDPAKLDINLSKFITEFIIVRMVYENTSDNKAFGIDDVQIQIKKMLA